MIDLVGRDGTPRVGSETDLKLEHFALSAEGRQAFERGLAESDMSHQRSELKEIGIAQFHLQDPDANHIRVDFDANE